MWQSIDIISCLTRQGRQEENLNSCKMIIDNILIKLYDYIIKMWKSVRRGNSCQAEYLWHIASIFTKNMLADRYLMWEDFSIACTLTDIICERNVFILISGFAGKEERMSKSREKKDTVEKEFVAFPDIAVDVINVLLYHGDAVTNEKTLLAAPTESVYQGKERLRSQYEDLCKYELAAGRINLIYLIANQSRVDRKMLLRKAGYTGGVYREQYEEKTKEIYPVIEFVLYWGDARWKSSRDIRQMFKKKRLPEKAWEYIDNLKLHVFEMRYLPEETRKLFQSDMRIVVDFLAEKEHYFSDRKVVHKAALIKMIKVLSGENDIDDIENWMEKQGVREEDEITVCELFDQYVRQGRQEGEKSGEARRLVEDVENVMKFFKVTLEKACEGLGTTVSGYEEAKKYSS